MSGRYAMCLIATGALRREIVPYYLAAPLTSTASYDPRVFRYIGEGYIYSIRQELMQGGPRLKFYVLKKDRPKWAR